MAQHRLPIAQNLSRKNFRSSRRSRAVGDLYAIHTTEESEPIIRLVNQFIETAYNMGASDIHIEPWENEVVVRYRSTAICDHE